MITISTLNKVVAKELGVNEKLVEDVNSFFWKHARKQLATLESTSFSIKHLGTITTSKRKIDYYIKNLIGKIRSIRKSTWYKDTTKEILITTNYEKLRQALKQRNILATQYYEDYAKWNKRVHETHTNNLEKLGSDHRRDDKSGEE